MEKFFKPLHLSGPQETPWLVFFSHGTRGKTQTFCSIVERRSYVKNLPEISRRKCMGYSHGWLIMNRWGTDDCSLLNPTTSEEIELPPLPPENEFPYRGHKCVVSSELKEANCVVVWTNFLERIILFCNPGEKKWRKVEFELHETVTCMGKVYGITSEGSLVVLDFDANPTVKLIEIAPPTSPLEDAKRFLVITYFSRRKLVESRGEIFLVSREYLFFGDIKDYVMCNVYKVDFAQKK